AVITTAGEAVSPAGPAQSVRDASPGRRAGVVVVDDEPIAVDVPSYGRAPLRPAQAPPVVAEGSTLDNGILRVTVDRDTGLVASIYDHEAGREVLSAPGNLLQLWHDEPLDYDAWDLDVVHTRMGVDLPAAADEVALSASGPVRASVEVRRGTFRQRITLDSRSRT